MFRNLDGVYIFLYWPIVSSTFNTLFIVFKEHDKNLGRITQAAAYILNVKQLDNIITRRVPERNSNINQIEHKTGQLPCACGGVDRIKLY